MKRARIASLASTLDQAPDERRAIVEWPSTPDGKPVAGCVVSATRASDGTPMLDVMDCDPATRVRVVWDNLARMSISDAMCDRALAAMGYRPAYPNEHARDAQRKTMRAAIEAAIYGEAQGLPAAQAPITFVTEAIATPRDMPACLADMGCLCAGHARGNPASAKCDTTETAPTGSCEVCERDDVCLTPDGKLVNHDADDPVTDPYEHCAGSGQVPAVPEPEDTYYACACSWVGGDPGKFRGVWICPACKKHDGKHVPVAASTIADLDQTRETLKLLWKYRGKTAHHGGTTVFSGDGRTTARRLAICASVEIANNCARAFNARVVVRKKARK